MKWKYLLSLVAVSLFVTYTSAQPGMWKWIKGDSIALQVPQYGTQGVSNPNNNSHAVYGPVDWYDQNGNFWVFGGGRWADRYNDLWKYITYNNQWTWMKGSGVPNDAGYYGIQGVSSPLNNPCPRIFGALSWVDNSGNLWLFGGEGNNVSSGPRKIYSDLWKYDVLTNKWTWMKGPNIPNVLGVYGSQGISNALNNPRARFECTAAWTDSLGDLWLFGGGAYAVGRFNDMWKYKIPSNDKCCRNKPY